MKRKWQGTYDPNEEILLKSLLNQCTKLDQPNVIKDRNRKTDSKEFCKITHHFKNGKTTQINHFVVDDQKFFSIIEKANLLADSFEEAHKLTLIYSQPFESVLPKLPGQPINSRRRVYTC